MARKGNNYEQGSPKEDYIPAVVFLKNILLFSQPDWLVEPDQNLVWPWRTKCIPIIRSPLSRGGLKNGYGGDNSTNMQGRIMVLGFCPFPHCDLSIYQVLFKCQQQFVRYLPDKVPDRRTERRTKQRYMYIYFHSPSWSVRVSFVRGPRASWWG